MMERRIKPTRSSSKLIAAMLGFAIVAAGFAILMVRLDVTQEGYRLSALRAEVAGLEKENRRLKVEAAELSSRQRLRALAAKYHLAPPAPGQVVTLP
jgi:cell division protein FtsL